METIERLSSVKAYRPCRACQFSSAKISPGRQSTAISCEASTVRSSLSEDPRSPHYGDQMDLYVNRKLRKVTFSMEEVAKEPGVERRDLR